MAQLFQIPRQLTVSANFLPLPGAVASFFLSGTTTPTNVYQNALLTVAHGVTVTTDGAGFFPVIYLDASKLYKVELRDSGGALLPGYPIDPCNDLLPQSGNTLTQVTGTNTIQATLTPNQPIVNGLSVILTPAGPNTTAATLELNLSAVQYAIRTNDDAALIGAELQTGIPAQLIFDASTSHWILHNSYVLKTRGLEAGPIDLIQRVVAGNDTAVIGDRGRCIAYNGAGGHTQTLPSNLFPIGTILVLKNANTVNWSVAAAGTLIWYNGSGAFPTGTRTLAGGSWATAHTTSATTWDFTGTGVS